MKTAISLPDDLFRRAEEAARRLGVPRSRLYARAVAEFVARYETSSVTARLNDVYADDPGEVDPLLFRLAMEAIPDEGW